MQLGIGRRRPDPGSARRHHRAGGVTCCGVGVDALWDGLLHPSVVGGPVRDFEPEQWFGPKEVRQLDRFAQFSIAAADLAVTDAGDLEADPANQASSSPPAWAGSTPWPSRSASTTNAGPAGSRRASSP
jgi:3-oxoacyl-(acyl-carrier-protein) synthase